MFTDIFLLSAGIAGWSVIWQKILSDSPTLRAHIQNNFPYVLSKILTCSFCFTYWSAFASALIFRPLGDWLPPLRILFMPSARSFMQFMLAWMIVSFSALALHFAFNVIHELIHYLAALTIRENKHRGS